MEIAIRTRDLEWNENLRKLVERRIDYAVDRHKSRIGRISTCLSDLKGLLNNNMYNVTLQERRTRQSLGINV